MVEKKKKKKINMEIWHIQYCHIDHMAILNMVEKKEKKKKKKSAYDFFPVFFSYTLYAMAVEQSGSQPRLQPASWLAGC